MDEDYVSLESRLRREIEAQIESLSQLEFGSKEHSAAVKDIAELTDALNKCLERANKVDAENERQAAENERFQKEMEFKKQQAEAEKKNCWIDTGLKVGGVLVSIIGVVLPLGCYNRWFHEGLEFEQTGSITSNMNKGLLNKAIKPGK